MVQVPTNLSGDPSALAASSVAASSRVIERITSASTSCRAAASIARPGMLRSSPSGAKQASAPGTLASTSIFTPTSFELLSQAYPLQYRGLSLCAARAPDAWGLCDYPLGK